MRIKILRKVQSIIHSLNSSTDVKSYFTKFQEEIDVLAILVTLMFYITGYCIFSPVHGYLLGNIFDKVPWYFTCLVPRVP